MDEHLILLTKNKFKIVRPWMGDYYIFPRLTKILPRVWRDFETIIYIILVFNQIYDLKI